MASEKPGHGKRTIATILIALLLSTVFVSAEEYEFSYDANGNMVQGKEHYFEYNGFNQLVRVRGDNSTGPILEEYAYDHEGNRVLKKAYNSTGDVWETTYYVDKNFIRVVNDSGGFDTVYYYHDDVLVGRQDYDGQKYFYHPDHLGSTDTVTDEAGNLVEKTDYLPFGEVFSGGNDRYLYTGKEQDDTGLQYYGARYYDPWMKRFTQPDSLIPDVYNPQSLNRYAYVLNNPYKYVDENGNVAILAPMAIGAAVGLGSYVLSHAMTGEAMSWKGAGAYTVGGALAGVTAVGTSAGLAAMGVSKGAAMILGGTASGTISKVSSNLGEGDKWSQGLLQGAIFGGISGGVASKFAYAGEHKITNLPSYFTTITGQRYISNIALEGGLDFLLNFAPEYITSNNGGSLNLDPRASVSNMPTYYQSGGQGYCGIPSGSSSGGGSVNTGSRYRLGPGGDVHQKIPGTTKSRIIRRG
jgi:RHS repeat-associated protein